MYVWGHPDGVDGATALGEDQVPPTLTATSIPPETWVELRTAFPTNLLTSTQGARVVSGDGLQLILDEEIFFAAESEQAAQAQRAGLIMGTIAAIAVALGLGLTTYIRYGREPKVAYDLDYEHAPPSDLSLAEVGALLTQGHVSEKEFTATLFDLIRQGAISATPIQTVRSTWGGLRQETISDLELELTDKTTGFRDFEQSVLTVVGRVLDDGPRPLHEFRSDIKDDAVSNATTYQTFRRRVLDAIERTGLLDTRGNLAAGSRSFSQSSLWWDPSSSCPGCSGTGPAERRWRCSSPSARLSGRSSLRSS